MNDRVFVVGGGPSLKEFRFSRLTRENTIVVNASAFDVVDFNYFITMDQTFFRKDNVRKKTFQFNSGCKVFVAGLHHSHLIETNGYFIDTRSNRRYYLEIFDVIVKAYKERGCGFTFNDFRSGDNSGFCALQLAVLLGFKTIYLLGIDLTTNDRVTHYHSLYSGERKFKTKLGHYLENFRLGIKDIRSESDVRVVSCSPISALNEYVEYRSVEEVLCKDTT